MQRRKGRRTDVEEDSDGHEGDEAVPRQAHAQDVEAVFFGASGRPEHQPFSNFAPTPVEIAGRTYRTVEHFYQASKAADPDDHDMVRRAVSPKEAKELGGKVPLRPDCVDARGNARRTGRARRDRFPARAGFEAAGGAA